MLNIQVPLKLNSKRNTRVQIMFMAIFNWDRIVENCRVSFDYCALFASATPTQCPCSAGAVIVIQIPFICKYIEIF